MSSSDEYIEVKTVDNVRLFLNPKLISACEVVPSSQRVEGHTKVYSGGFKYSVQEEISDFLKKLGHTGPV